MLKIATKFAPEHHALELAWRAGYRCAEFWLNANLLSNWERIAEMASNYAIQYVLHCPNQTGLGRSTLAELVQLARAVGSSVVVIHDEHWIEYGGLLGELAPDLNFAVENHVVSADQFAAWSQNHAALTLDVEHFWKFTLGDATLPYLLDRLAEVLPALGDKLRHVHLPGYLPGFDEHRPMYCSREMVFATLDLLSQQSYDGAVVSEMDLIYQNQRELVMDRLLFETWEHQIRSASLLRGPRSRATPAVR